MPKQSQLLSIFMLLALTGLSWLSVRLLVPHGALPATAPAAAFSAERAMRYVRQVAQQPHAMGTAAHAEVRQYLLEQMRALHLSPEVQEATVVNNAGGVALAGHVYNLVGRLSGTSGNGKAVLLMAHYDSQPNARGAGDDGAGVAALLETARALQQSEPLQHDVIFLLTDGEEYGLFGARAFLEHPWAAQVGVVLNLEGRGNSGPSMTFEMNTDNGWVAKQYIQAAPYPFVNSLAYEIYSRMPNNTDFTVFKEAGYAGLNAAFIDGFVNYHKLTDSPGNLNTGSLQQHGSNLLALTRHFGNLSLAQTKAPDIVFFNAVGSWVISYGKGLNLLWVALAAVLLTAVFSVGNRQQIFSSKQAAAGFIVYLLLLVVVVAVFFPINKLVLGLLPYTHPFNGVYGSDTFFIAYLLLALGIFLLLSWLALRWLNLYALLIGVFILWFLLAVVLIVFVPSATYLLAFPLLFALAGILVVFVKRLHLKPSAWQYGSMLLLAVVPAVFVVVPIVQVVFVAFSLQLPMAMVALLVLLSGLLLPLLHLLVQPYQWKGVPLLPLALLLLGVLGVGLAVQGEKPTAARPLHSHVSYFLNADTDQAYWVSAFPTTDLWNRQFFTDPVVGPLQELYPIASVPYLKNKAETLPLPPPVAELAHDSVEGDERLLRLRLTSPRGAAHLELLLQPEDSADLLMAGIDEEPLALHPVQRGVQPAFFIRLYGLPPSKQVSLELRLKRDSQLQLLLYDQSMGLPQQLVKQPMPAEVVPEQGRDSNLTVVRKSYSF